MALFFIEAVRFDGSGTRVEKVRWGKSRGGEVTPPAMVAQPEEVEVDTVIDAIASGDEVITKFNINGHAEMGPQVKIAIQGDGSRSIATGAHDVPGRGLADLPQF